MSYPSVNRHLEIQGANLNTATEAQLASALLSAFEEDLSLGMAEVGKLIKKLEETGDRAMHTLHPNSVEGKQFARLLAPDMPRQVLQEHFGVQFGFYNCCKGIVSHTHEGLQLSLREQIEAQHPNFVDC